MILCYRWLLWYSCGKCSLPLPDAGCPRLLGGLVHEVLKAPRKQTMRWGRHRKAFELSGERNRHWSERRAATCCISVQQRVSNKKKIKNILDLLQRTNLKVMLKTQQEILVYSFCITWAKRYFIYTCSFHCRRCVTQGNQRCCGRYSSTDREEKPAPPKSPQTKHACLHVFHLLLRNIKCF